MNQEREIKIIKTFEFPIESLWDAWTKPEQIANWWGPKGFTSTIHQMDFRENGEWILTLHKDDGTNFPNKSIFKEIIPQAKIVFEHFFPHFITTVLFASEGNKSTLEWTMLFETKELRDIIVDAHKADQGQRENIDKLDEYLTKNCLLSKH